MDLRKLIFAFAFLTVTGHAQFLGYVASQSSAQTAFTAQAANGASVTFNNVGQSSHFLSYCTTNFVGVISLEGSSDGTFTPSNRLSAGTYNTADTGCHVLPAGGYYPAVRAQVSNYSAGSVTASYTAIAAPISVTHSAINSTGPFSPVQCDQTTFINSVVSPFTNTLVPGIATQNIYVCSIAISVQTVSANDGNITAEYGTNGGSACSSGTVQKWTVTLLHTISTPPFFAGGSLGALFKIPKGQDLCFAANITGGAYTVSITYAQF